MLDALNILNKLAKLLYGADVLFSTIYGNLNKPCICTCTRKECISFECMEFLKKNLVGSNHEEKKNCRVQATGKKVARKSCSEKKIAQLQMFMPPQIFK